MRKTTLFIVILTIVIGSVAGLAGCTPGSGGKDDEVVIDPKKTQLYVGNLNAAFGDAWIKELGKKFEQENPDIQVIIDNEIDAYSDTNLQNSIKTDRQDIYLLSHLSYDTYVTRGLLAEITDIVTTPLNELTDYIDSEDGESLKDKMISPTQVDHFERDDGSFYGIPFYDAFFGLVYDVDLFDQKNLYFQEGSNSFINNTVRTKSKGPDGVGGSYDDGLPMNYTQFRLLLERMKAVGVTPLTWTGRYQNYLERYLMSVWADYEGRTNYEINTSFSGSYTFAGDTTATPINQSNAYLLQKQSGKTYTLELCKLIASDSAYYSANALLPSQTHRMAQDEFIYSRIKSNTKPIGMLVEAAWWENESDKTFSEIAEERGSQWSRHNRKFALMPVPKADDGSSHSGRTMLSANGTSLFCINGASSKQDLAKKFMLFLQTEESLRTFTRMTGVPRPYKYDLTASDLSELSYFSKTIWDAYKNPSLEIVYNNIYQTNLRVTNASYFLDWSWGSTIEGKDPYTNPILAFRDNSDLTVAQYQQGMLKKFENTWLW